MRHLPRRLAATLLVLAGCAWIARDVWPDGQAGLGTVIPAGLFVAFGFWLFDRQALQAFGTWALSIARGAKEAR